MSVLSSECVELRSSDSPHSGTTSGLGTWQGELGATASDTTCLSSLGVISTGRRPESVHQDIQVVAAAPRLNFLAHSRVQILPGYWG